MSSRRHGGAVTHVPTDAATRRGRAAVTGLVGAVLLLGLTATVAAADDKDHLKDRRAAVGARIDAAGSSLDDSSARLARTTWLLGQAQTRLAAAEDRLATTRGELAAAQQYAVLMRQRLAAAERRLAVAEDNLARGRRQVRSAEQRLAEFVVSSAQYGDPGVVAIDTLMNGDDPNDLSQQLALTDSVLGVEITSIDDLDAAKVLLALREREVSDTRDEVARRRDRATATVARIRELQQRAQQEAAAVRQLVTRRAVAEQRAAHARAVDLAKLEALEAERERIGERLQRIAAREAARTISHTGGGFLSAPASGGITSPYGMRMHPVLRVRKLHDGTDFAAACGTPIRAAAAGQVISAYSSIGYGKQVVVSHGSINGRSLATSYAHLDRFAVGAGQRVERGQVVGYAGDTGYSTGCHVHFMVYVDGRTVDPVGWL